MFVRLLEFDVNKHLQTAIYILFYSWLLLIPTGIISIYFQSHPVFGFEANLVFKICSSMLLGSVVAIALLIVTLEIVDNRTISQEKSRLEEKSKIFNQKLNQLETNIASLNNNITNTQIVIDNAIDSGAQKTLDEIIWMLDQVGDIKEAKALLKDYEKSADMIKNIRKQAANNVIPRTTNTQTQPAQSNGIPINISNVTIPRRRSRVLQEEAAYNSRNIFSRMLTDTIEAIKNRGDRVLEELPYFEHRR